MLFICCCTKTRGGGLFRNGFARYFLDVVFPIGRGDYWFITVYILLYATVGSVNALFEVLDKKKHLFFLLFFFLAFVFCASVIGEPYIDIQRAFFAFSMGMYLRKYPIKIVKYKCLIVFFLFWILMWGTQILQMDLQIRSIRYGKYMIRLLDSFWRYPLASVCSLSLFVLLSRMELPDNVVVNKVADATFGVYLLHMSPMMEAIWLLTGVERLYRTKFYPLFIMPLLFISYIVFTFVELTRKNLFRKIHGHFLSNKTKD